MGKHTARGQGSVTYRADKDIYMGRVSIEGTRYTVYDKKQKGAVQKLQQLISDVSKGKYKTSNSWTVGEWIDEWNHTYLPSIGTEGTRSKYERDMRLYITPELGHKKLTDLRQGDIQRVCTNLAERLSPKTISNAINTFHEILKAAVNNKYLKENPCEKIEIPEDEDKEMEIMTAEELDKFLKMAKADRYGELFYIGAYTGMRKGELLGLTWDCIDFEKKIIRVRKQLIYSPSKKQYTLEPPKRNSKRTFVAPEEVFDMLQGIQERQKKWKQLYGRQWKDRNGLVFTHEDGENYAGQTVYHHYKAIAEAMGRPNLRLHDLRHTFATLTIQGGGNIKALSEQLGHKSVTITIDRYTHTTTEMMGQNVNAITKVMKKFEQDT